MNLLIIDTETTGIDPEKYELLEIGAILYNVETRSILAQMSSLMRIVGENEAYNTNKIKKESAELSPEIVSSSCISFIKDNRNYDYVVAHNAKFDRDWLIKKVDFDEDIPWICTYTMLSLDNSGGKKDLVSIALSLGVPIVSAHRALTDCALLAECFNRLPDLESRIENALIPRFTYIAKTSYDDREKAKAAGFIWDRLVSRQWAKNLTEEEAKADFGFSLVRA